MHTYLLQYISRISLGIRVGIEELALELALDLE
jgi:hypothetical protein